VVLLKDTNVWEKAVVSVFRKAILKMEAADYFKMLIHICAVTWHITPRGTILILIAQRKLPKITGHFNPLMNILALVPHKTKQFKNCKHCATICMFIIGF
jgi:hypothetical protein